MTIKANNITIIIFDLDGTIVHLPVNWAKLKQRLIQKKIILEQQTLTSSINNAKSRTNKTKLAHLLSVLDHYERQSISHLKINQNIYHWIKTNANSYHLAICSSNLHATIEAVLKKLNISQCFDQIIGNEDVDKLKPNPEGINKILSNISANNKQAIFIGDKPNDHLTATNAGVSYCHPRKLSSHRIKQ